MPTQSPSAPPFRGLYLLPNLLTTLALFCGFLAIAFSIQGAPISAAKALFLGMVADGLDGRIARLTETQSEFGKQYDSLSDLVTFGVAPAVMLLTGVFSHFLGHIGQAAAFAYMALTTIRLARFNIGETCGDFKGLPCPAAAAFLVSTMWVFHSDAVTLNWSLFFAFFAIVLGVLMVSTVPYPSFKTLDVQKNLKLSVCLMVFICALIFINPPWVLWVLFASYVLYGLIRGAICAIRTRSIRG